MKQTALYLCYQSVREPLTQTQVIAYLEGLALAGYRMVLLTFEPQRLTDSEERDWRERLAKKGISWHWLRYHKWPTVPATAWDILCGVAFGWRLVRKYGVRLLHARCHVPGLMAIALKQLTGAKLLFDLRGLMAEEYVEGGVWPAGGTLFRATKRVERTLVEAADGIVVLTHQARILLEKWHPRVVRRIPVRVIPCCVDLRQAAASGTDSGVNRFQPSDESTIVYVGKLGGSYLTEAMVRFVAVAKEFMPKLRWKIWTQSESSALPALVASHHLNDRVAVGYSAPDELATQLRRANLALAFYKPGPSKLATSPTKVGEYLAAGLPVVATAGIGDLDSILNGQEGNESERVGILVREFTEDAYKKVIPALIRLLNDPEVRNRCRAAARAHFDLVSVGWARYRELYDMLMPNAHKEI